MNVHLLKARMLLQQGRNEPAASEFRRALQDDPEDSDIHAGLAMALLRTDRWQEASEAARTSVAKDPGNPLAHWVMTLVWLERGHLKEAEGSIRSALELDPDDADNYGLLSRVLWEMDRPADALAAADTGLSLDAKNDLSLTFRARALMALGRDAEARMVTATLLKEDPNDAFNHLLLGDQLVSEGRPKDAREHYFEALRLDPKLEAARHGFVLSLKSRSPIFTMAIRVLMAGDRMKTWALWAAIILTIAGLQFGNSWVATHPEWAASYAAVKRLLWAGVVLLIVANPLFDIILRFDREGRRALSDDEIEATNWYLVCFTFAALCAVWALFVKSATMPNRIGFGFIFLTRAVAETFTATRGYVRKRMAVATWIGGASLVAAPAVLILGVLRILATKHASDGKSLILAAIWLPLVAITISGFADDIRGWLEKRRPDRS